jgi:hypothetical protein
MAGAGVKRLLVRSRSDIGSRVGRDMRQLGDVGREPTAAAAAAAVVNTAAAFGTCRRLLGFLQSSRELHSGRKGISSCKQIAAAAASAGQAVVAAVAASCASAAAVLSSRFSSGRAVHQLKCRHGYAAACQK